MPSQISFRESPNNATGFNLNCSEIVPIPASGLPNAHALSAFPREYHLKDDTLTPHPKQGHSNKANRWAAGSLVIDDLYKVVRDVGRLENQ
jgi:hypothetical protein